VPWVAFAIVPIFALANAGVALGGDVLSTLTEPVALGVIVGLLLGKQLGITLTTWLVVRLGLAVLPSEVTWRQISGVSWLAGIGFTTSLFIAGLAFGEGALLAQAKVGILVAAIIAGVGGWGVLSHAAPEDRRSAAP
jgi:NhaA family Na+:H+ antiporter